MTKKRPSKRIRRKSGVDGVWSDRPLVDGGFEQVPRTLPLAQIQLDIEMQTRVLLDDNAVAEYAEAYVAGVELPPVIVFFDGVHHVLADGWHRYRAAERAGLTELPALVRSGSRQDALLFAVGANVAHGVRRTNADKRLIAELLLGEPELATMSDRALGQLAAISHTLVAHVRVLLYKSTGTGCQSGTRKGRDGKVRRLPRRPRDGAPAPLVGEAVDDAARSTVSFEGSTSLHDNTADSSPIADEDRRAGAVDHRRYQTQYDSAAPQLDPTNILGVMETPTGNVNRAAVLFATASTFLRVANEALAATKATANVSGHSELIRQLEEARHVVQALVHRLGGAAAG